MTGEDAAVGCIGTVVIATRGLDGPGEVLIAVRGGSEAYVGWSDTPMPVGSCVLAVAVRSPGTVDVVPWTDPFPMTTDQTH